MKYEVPLKVDESSDKFNDLLLWSDRDGQTMGRPYGLNSIQKSRSAYEVSIKVDGSYPQNFLANSLLHKVPFLSNA